MSLVTKGILTQQLPWGLVLLGVFTSILMEIIGVPALAFAVGMYLPLESTTPIFLGGLVRKLVDWRRGSEAESDAGPGVLFSSGLVAGGSIMGLASSFLASTRPSWMRCARRSPSASEALPASSASSPSSVWPPCSTLPRARARSLRRAHRRHALDTMKVAFIGTHGVGKTTLCYDVAGAAQEARRQRGHRQGSGAPVAAARESQDLPRGPDLDPDHPGRGGDPGRRPSTRWWSATAARSTTTPTWRWPADGRSRSSASWTGG